MAKRFTEQVAIRQQDLSTGFTQGANSLLNRLQSFKQSSERLVDVVETQRGQEEAQQVKLEKTEVDGFSITASPKKKEAGFIEMVLTGGAATSQYNKSLRASYVASVGNDTREHLKSIEAENPDNIALFNDKASSYAAGVLKGVDPAIKDSVEQFINNHITDSRIRVQAASTKRNQEVADIERADAIEGSTDAAIGAARDNNPQAAGEYLLQTKEILDSYVGQPGVDQAGADFTFKQIQKRVAIESIRSNVRSRAATNGGIASVSNELMTFMDSPLKGFTDAEQQAVQKTLISDLNQTVTLKNKMEKAQHTIMEDSQDGKSESLYLGVLDGDISAGDITSALENKEISQKQASTLINIVQSSGTGIDDWSLVNQIEDDIRNGISENEINFEIANNTGSRLTESTARSLFNKFNEYKDKESPLKTSVSRRAEDFIISSMRVTGPLGSLDSEAERRLAVAKREFAERVLEGEDPFEVADGLVDTDTLSRAPRPLFGTKENLDSSLIGLNEAMEAGTIDDETYNREWNNIETLKQLTANIELFNKAKKDHDLAIK